MFDHFTLIEQNSRRRRESLDTADCRGHPWIIPFFVLMNFCITFGWSCNLSICVLKILMLKWYSALEWSCNLSIWVLKILMFKWYRASEYPREYDGACLQMRLSYSQAAHTFLFLVQWIDCRLAGALGLLRILIYKVIIMNLFHTNCNVIAVSFHLILI